jgi:aquaporin Z
MKKYLSEYIATFALVFCGTGAIVINELSGNAVSHLGVGMTFGLIVIAMIYSFGHVSGAHLNPAVTFAFWLSGRFPLKNLLPYVISQLLGAITASLILKFLFPDAQNIGITQPYGSVMQSFVLETILTFILMLVIIHTSTGAKEIGVFAGLGIGSTVMLEAIFAGPVSGASMNPARSFAPALISNNFDHLWLYILAPCVGQCH